jgi:hypothetical protein
MQLELTRRLEELHNVCGLFGCASNEEAPNAA